MSSFGLHQSIRDAIKSGPTPVFRNLKVVASKEWTRGEKVIAFIEKHCVVPEGDLVGKPVLLADFQKAFILAIYDNPFVTDTAILSIARKNAKTGTIAFILLAHLVGPEAVRNSRIVSGAMSRDQAAEVYNLASKCVALSPTLDGICKIIPSSKTIIGLPMNVEYKAISAEGKTAHGKSPIVAILDEVGQIVGPQSDFVDAITTAQGAYNNPLLIYISTQAATDADFLSIAIDDATKNRPEKTVCHVYAADPEAGVLDEVAWYAANPALGLFRSLADMTKQAQKASRMPSFENSFRNLMLNQRVVTTSPLISRDVWKSCGSAPAPLTGMKVDAGLDLSKRTDLTAFVAVGRDDDGIGHVHCLCWTPEVGLHDRAKRDRVPYDMWVKEGFLRTTPGATVDYEFVIADIIDFLNEHEIDLDKLAFDRWRIDVFKKECERAGVELPLVEFGQGFKDMSPAIDILEADLLNARLRHGNHPLLSMAAANAVDTKDPADNRKLDKMKSTGRIDPLQALCMALGAAGGVETLDDLDDFIRNPITA